MTQGKGLVPRDCTHRQHLGSQILRPVCYLCVWPINYRLKIPVPPSLCSINLLEQFTEFREILAFISLLKDIIKHTEKQPDEEIHRVSLQES